MASEKISDKERQVTCVTVEIQQKLYELGGGRYVPLKRLVPEIRKKLGWWDVKAEGRIKRLLYGEQEPYRFIDEIRKAHTRHCLRQVESNCEANRQLIEQFSEAVRYFETVDPDFYREQIEAMRETLERLERPAR